MTALFFSQTWQYRHALIKEKLFKKMKNFLVLTVVMANHETI